MVIQLNNVLNISLAQLKTHQFTNWEGQVYPSNNFTRTRIIPYLYYFH